MEFGAERQPMQEKDSGVKDLSRIREYTPLKEWAPRGGGPGLFRGAFLEKEEMALGRVE